MNFGFKINICALTNSFPVLPNSNPNPYIYNRVENEFGFENNYLCPHQVGPYTT